MPACLSACLYSSSSVVSEQWWRLLSDEGNVLFKETNCCWRLQTGCCCCCCFQAQQRNSAEFLFDHIRTSTPSYDSGEDRFCLFTPAQTTSQTSQSNKSESNSVLIELEPRTRTSRSRTPRTRTSRSRTSVRHQCQHQPRHRRGWWHIEVIDGENRTRCPERLKVWMFECWSRWSWGQPVCVSGAPVGAELNTPQEQTGGSRTPLLKVQFFY